MEMREGSSATNESERQDNKPSNTSFKASATSEASSSDKSPTKHIWGQAKTKNNTLPLAMIQKLQEEKEKELENKKKQAPVPKLYPT